MFIKQYLPGNNTWKPCSLTLTVGKAGKHAAHLLR
jgi:hypothetical protein